MQCDVVVVSTMFGLSLFDMAHNKLIRPLELTTFFIGESPRSVN